MPEPAFIVPILGCQRVQRLSRGAHRAALFARGRLRRVAAGLADPGMRGDRLQPFRVGQARRREVGGGEQVVWVAEGASLQQRFGPSPVREACVKLLLGLRGRQGIELGDAAYDQTLTFQLDG